jgi:hypothetical protein
MQDSASLASGDRPVRVKATYATHELLPLLGVSPVLGRWFEASEDRPGDRRVIVIGHDLWQRMFGGDPAILGKQVQLDAVPVNVIGVMPRGFQFPDRDARGDAPRDTDAIVALRIVRAPSGVRPDFGHHVRLPDIKHDNCARSRGRHAANFLLCQRQCPLIRLSCVDSPCAPAGASNGSSCRTKLGHGRIRTRLGSLICLRHGSGSPLPRERRYSHGRLKRHDDSSHTR